MGRICSPGGIENPRSSVIGLFRRESTSSTHMSSCESSPGRGSDGRDGRNGSQSQPHHFGPSAVLLIEESTTDPLGVLQAPPTNPAQFPHQAATMPRASSARRGSMLELPSGSVSNQTDQTPAHNSI